MVLHGIYDERTCMYVQRALEYGTLAVSEYDFIIVRYICHTQQF